MNDMNVQILLTERNILLVLAGILILTAILFFSSYRKRKGKKGNLFFDCLIVVFLIAATGYAVISGSVHTRTYEDLNIPEYSGNAYTLINDNHPFFTEEELQKEPFEAYEPLDFYGRTGTAQAMLDYEMMPETERGSIQDVTPSGWHTVRYDDLIEDKYLYNRCHLIAYELTGQNNNPQNLITGTRYLNIEGMLPWENKVASYIRRTQNHVLYRVTPVYQGEDLLARGVLLEARSVEDSEIEFCVYCYNVQPGVSISYADGESHRQ